MIFNRKILFDGLRKALVPNKGFNDRQVTVIGEVVTEFERRKLADIRWLAYMLATAWHEARFMSVREGDPQGKGISDAKARAIVTAYCKRKGKKNYAAAHPVTGQSYYARGLPGLTHYDNYLKFEQTLNLPLTTDPDMALLVPVTVAILFEGMTTGVTAKDSFTKYQLHDFFNASKDDAVGARRIINGTDKAKLIADYHFAILNVLEVARRPDPVVVPKPDVVAKPKPVRPELEGGGIAGGAGAAVVVTAAATGWPWWVIGGLAVSAIVIALGVYVAIQKRKPS